MKDFRTMKRQRGRNRKPSGQSHNPNRAYESGGPEGIKVRGNAQTVYEKYQQLARDANASGDRVLAEAYLQHAEHYFRLIRLAQPQRPVSEFVQRDPFSTGYEDYDDDIIEAPERPMEARSEQAQPYDRADDNRDSPRDFPQREFNREQSRDQNRDFPRERDGSSRRETRRERYERKKQQRFSQGPDSERGDFELTRFEPSALAPTTPITPPAIASTQPLQAASQRTPVNEPRMVEARPATQDANALPDFIRVPSPAQQTVFESEPHTKNAVDFDDTAAPKPRKPRGRPKAVISDESHQTEA